VGGGDPAGPERDPQRVVAVEGADGAGRERAPVRGGVGRLRPHRLAVELDPVGVDPVRLQPLDQDQGVVVVLDPERGGAAAHPARGDQHLDLGRGVGLDPDGGLRLADVPQQRTKDELRHGVDATPAPERTRAHPGGPACPR
jgi:hypothetical protein